MRVLKIKTLHLRMTFFTIKLRASEVLFYFNKNKVCLSSATNFDIKIRKNSNTFHEIILFNLNIKKINYRIQSEDGYFVISETKNCTKLPTGLNYFVQIFWTFFCMLKISSDSYKIIVHKKKPSKPTVKNFFQIINSWN